MTDQSGVSVSCDLESKTVKGREIPMVSMMVCLPNELVAFLCSVPEVAADEVCKKLSEFVSK